jgi:AraC-like DNA-binding protein
MLYRYQKPHRLLSEYVKTVLIVEGVGLTLDNKLPLFTNGMPAFLCSTVKTSSGIINTRQLTLYGKSTPTDLWELKENETIIAYFFNPFSLASFFNLSAAAIVKNPVELSGWDAHKTNALRTQLSYAKKTAEKIEVLDGLLLQQFKERRRECEIIRQSTDRIMMDSGKEVLSEILEELNLNERTFQRIFKKFVGITPSQYRRICQFKVSFEKLRTGNFDKLTDVAYETGFADQSHFIRSFKEFTDITPKDYKKSGLKRK